jgi:hypothetical protein
MDRKNEVPEGKNNYYVLPVVHYHKVRRDILKRRKGSPAAVRWFASAYGLQSTHCSNTILLHYGS